MSARTVRRALAAGVVALALVGAGAAGASAADTVPDVPTFGGTLYLADGSTGDDVPLDATVAYDFQAIALPAPGDLEGKFPIPAGAETVRTFLAPQGQEAVPSQWNAYADISLTPGGVYLPNVTPLNQVGNGTGSPQGTNAVKAAGGNYSIGVAFLKTNNLVVVDDGLYFVHISVTPGTGAYTYAQVEAEAAPLTATTTTLTAPATAAENAAVSLSAAVTPAGATGSVEYYDGTTLIGTSPVGSPFDVPAGFAAGSHSLTAKYLGDTTFAGSTSAPSTLTVAGTPVDTTTAATATSATGKAGQPVALSATVTAANATTPTGSVTFSASDGGPAVVLGSGPVDGSGVAAISTSALPAGSWTITAAFTGTGVYTGSSGTTTAPLVLTVNANAAEPDPQTVVVRIPEGSLTITTPWTPANPLDLGTLTLNDATSTFELAAPVAFASETDIAQAIKITNSRPDIPHFTAQVASTDFTNGPSSFAAATAGLVGLHAKQLPGNALVSSNVVVNDVPALAAAPSTFATYSSNELGTAWIYGNLDISGVPTSTPSGTYTATLTFTAF